MYRSVKKALYFSLFALGAGMLAACETVPYDHRPHYYPYPYPYYDYYYDHYYCPYYHPYYCPYPHPQPPSRPVEQPPLKPSPQRPVKPPAEPPLKPSPQRPGASPARPPVKPSTQLPLQPSAQPFPLTEEWAIRLKPGTEPRELARDYNATFLGPVGSLPDTWLLHRPGFNLPDSQDPLRHEPRVIWLERQVRRQMHKRPEQAGNSYKKK